MLPLKLNLNFSVFSLIELDEKKYEKYTATFSYLNIFSIDVRRQISLNVDLNLTTISDVIAKVLSYETNSKSISGA